MSKTYRCDIEVRGYELDSFGHVNHAVYLNYFEHARWRMLAEEGITLEWITREKLWPVIASAQIKYLKPAFMGDRLEIRSRAVDAQRMRFTFEQDIYRGDVHLTSARYESAIVNEKGRPVETPELYYRLWN
jgi:YbgC/YbaW family acyl-CoA thioester hydrolase